MSAKRVFKNSLLCLLFLTSPLLHASNVYQSVPAAYNEIATRYEVPRKILYAMALVESRRTNLPWPWTLNISGKAQYFETREEAVSAASEAIAGGNHDVAIGIMQIYWRYHKHQFKSVGEVLDPHRNLSYGAQYLRSLYEQSGDWFEAVGHYYTGPNPETTVLKNKAKNYAKKVISQWERIY